MLKSIQLVKVRELEIAAVDAVRDLLGCVPNVEINSVGYEETIGRRYQIDARDWPEP